MQAFVDYDDIITSDFVRSGESSADLRRRMRIIAVYIGSDLLEAARQSRKIVQNF